MTRFRDTYTVIATAAPESRILNPAHEKFNSRPAVQTTSQTQIPLLVVKATGDGI
jgi:hypothetical protein